MHVKRQGNYVMHARVMAAKFHQSKNQDQGPVGITCGLALDLSRTPKAPTLHTSTTAVLWQPIQSIMKQVNLHPQAGGGA